MNRFQRPLLVLAILGFIHSSAHAQQTEPVVTVLTDFEDDSVAAQISDVRNVLAADCSVKRVNIPARATSSLAVEIGATQPQASAACDLLLRVPVRFAAADRVATYCWIKTSPVRVIFRLRDSRDQVFETAPQTVTDVNRWVYVQASLTPDSLTPPQPSAKLVWPIQILGYRVEIEQIGRTAVYLDELQVEHKVSRPDTIRGGFVFDQLTKIYEPGQTVGAKVSLENRSRQNAAVLSVELAWVRPDGTKLKTEQKTGINLPKSGMDYRATQQIDFSLRIDDPGVYRLVARARGVGWVSPTEIETTIAVTPSNKLLSRGRQVFFGLRTNLFREPLADQLLEIDVARQLGTQLFAIDTPWRLIQPKPDKLELDALDKLVDTVSGKNMALMLTVAEPPDWLAESGTDPSTAQAYLVSELAKRYGARVSMFQILAGKNAEETESTLRTVSDAAAKTHPDLKFLAPPSRLQAGKPFTSVRPAATQPATTPASMPQAGSVVDCLETTDDSLQAVDLVAEIAKPLGDRGLANAWWQHIAPAEMDAGTLHDTEAILQQYIFAAQAGVGGLIWFDLRDDDNDPANPSSFRGLVARDFSPRNRLLGLASTIGELNGLHYVGAAQGAPAEFVSAMFLGADRQVVVLAPRPNRVLPGLLAPVSGVRGRIAVQDLQRVNLPLLAASTPPLLRSTSRPVFVVLKMEQVDPEPQLLFARPWLRVPSRVFVEDQGIFHVELTAPMAIKNGYLRIAVPANSPVSSKFGARQIKAAAGETLDYEVQLAVAGKGDFQRAEISLQLSLRGSAVEIEVPIEVVRQVPLLPATSVTAPNDALSVGKLTCPERTASSVQVYASYQPDQLRFAIAVHDDHPVPYKPGLAGIAAGDELLFGLALENSDQLAEVRVIPAGNTATLVAINGTTNDHLKGWRCTVSEAAAKEPRTFQLTIPAASLGLERFNQGTRVLSAVRYADDSGAGKQDCTWGAGLDGGRSTAGFIWLRLSE